MNTKKKSKKSNMNTKKKTKMSKKSKKSKMNTKKKSKKSNMNTTIKKGGNILNSITNSFIQAPKKKNYTVRVPGSGLMKSISSYTSSKQPLQNKILKIIFNYHLPNQFDITEKPPNTIISSKSVTKEPYILVNTAGKYLLVIYREVIKKNMPTPKLL